MSSSSLEQSGDLDGVWTQVTAMLNTCARLVFIFALYSEISYSFFFLKLISFFVKG